MSGDISPLPQYAFMAWRSVKKALWQLHLYHVVARNVAIMIFCSNKQNYVTTYSSVHLEDTPHSRNEQNCLTYCPKEQTLS
jgi:hypothetical protein